MVASLEGTHYLISEASEITGIPVSTLRRWYRTNRTKAPSKEAIFGDLTVYLYTEEDLKELRAVRSRFAQKRK